MVSAACSSKCIASSLAPSSSETSLSATAASSSSVASDSHHISVFRLPGAGESRIIVHVMCPSVPSGALLRRPNNVTPSADPPPHIAHGALTAVRTPHLPPQVAHAHHVDSAGVGTSDNAWHDCIHPNSGCGSLTLQLVNRREPSLHVCTSLPHHRHGLDGPQPPLCSLFRSSLTFRSSLRSALHSDRGAQ